MDEQKSCAERIDEQLEGRLKDIKEALKSDKKRQEFEEGILSCDKRISFKICLSYGGPADYFIINVDPEDHQIMSIQYQFQDWFDGAEKYLEGDEFEAVAQMFSYLTEF